MDSWYDYTEFKIEVLLLSTHTMTIDLNIFPLSFHVNYIRLTIRLSCVHRFYISPLF